MNMVGLVAKDFTDPLFYVGDADVEKPIRSFDSMEAIGEPARNYMFARFGEDVTFEDRSHHMEFMCMKRLSYDQICKVRFSTIYMMDKTVEDEFEKTPKFALVQKITNSMWRCGFTKGNWNEIVDCRNSLLSFDLGLDDFEIRLDHTKYHHSRGGGLYSDVYLDGVFAYLVYYRGEHVMTLGFSIMGDYRILVQQIQMTKRKGNRWLFKFPANRNEFILDRFRAAFPHHAIYIADGGDTARKNLSSHESGLAEIHRMIRSYERDLDVYDDPNELLRINKQLDKYRAAARTAELEIEHLRGDVDRLRDQYANVGRYRLGEKLQVNDLTHYRIKE